MVSTTSVSGPRVHSLLVSAKRQWPGRGVARVWYNRGVRTLEDVAACKGGIKLTAAQMIGLKYYDGASSFHRLFCIASTLNHTSGGIKISIREFRGRRCRRFTT